MSAPSILQLLKEHTFSADSIIEQKRDVISISPALDYILGGGIESGSLCIVTGPPKTGKTSTCLHIAKKAQQMGYNIVFLNIEARLSRRDIISAVGLERESEKLRIIQSTLDRVLTGEQFIGMAENILTTELKTLLIFDSFSQLISQDEMDDDIDKQTRDSIPKILSKFCKRILPNLCIRNNICIGITHEVANTGYGMSTRSETSGRKIQYANNFKLRAGYSKQWLSDGAKKDIIGQTIEWECLNSALGCPGKKISGYLRYNYGLDEEMELIDIAEPISSILSKGGSWYSIASSNGGEPVKAQGKNGLAALLKEDRELFETLRAEVKDRVG